MDRSSLWRRLGARGFGDARHDGWRLIHVASRHHEPLRFRVLPRDAAGQRRAAHLPIPRRELLLVLAAEAEPVGASHVDLLLDFGPEPVLVGPLVILPHLPLAGVVLEG